MAERKALFMSIGTRGDMEPFITAAELLRNHGWEVACQFPEQFRSMVEELDIPFYGFDRRFLELIEGKSGKAVMGREGGLVKRIRSLLQLIRASKRLQRVLLEQQATSIEEYAPDRLIHHPKCLYGYLYAEAHQKTCLQLIPLPGILHPIAGRSSIVFKGGPDRGRVLNHLSYVVINKVRSFFVYRMTKKFQKQIGISQYSAAHLNRQMLERHEAVYPISPTLFSQPQWPDHVHILGYHERTKSKNWNPSKELLAFLDRHEKIVFISFGSMSNPKPDEKTKTIVAALTKFNIPAIINVSWGGLVEIETVPDYIHFVHGIPYDWIFPRMYAVIHHGGSGTTHTACKYGCPSLIIPHIVDQFFWNRTIQQLGLGPLGISIDRLRLDKLIVLLNDLYFNETYKTNALTIKNRMANEGLEEQYVKCLEGEINSEAL